LKRSSVVQFGVRALMALSFGLVAAAPTPAPSPGDFILDFVSELKGNLEHCGCHTGQYGGVSRRMAFEKKQLRTPTHRMIISGGDIFPPGGAEEMRRGQFMMRALRQMPLDAVTVADYDFTFGLKTLTDELKDLPLVTTNMTWADNGKRLGVPMMVKTYTGIPSLGEPGAKFKVAVLALMDDRLQSSIDFYLEKDKRKIAVQPAKEAAAEWVKKAHEQADIVVAMVHMNTTDAMQFAKDVPGIDVLVAGHSGEQIVDPPKKSGNTWIVCNGDRGRFIGEVRLTLDKDHHIADTSTREFALDTDVGEDSTMTDLVDQYKHQLAVDRGETSLRGGKYDIAPSYATFQVCGSCHKEIMQSWQQTAHSHAYTTLVKNGDEQKEECVKCHVLGMGSAGGFDPKSPQPILMDVQCESCHGSGVKHSMASKADKKGSILAKPGPEICLNCHTAKWDPNFNYAEKWAKIKH